MKQQDKAQAAGDFFRQGYNCAQSVAAAFAPEMGLRQEDVLKMSSSFGGGMGGLREVCGAVSGMFLVMGAVQGYASSEDPQAKKEHYARLQAMAKRFTDTFETLNCGQLLASHEVQPEAVPALRTEEYYKKRPCARYVEACAAILQEALQPHKG